MFEQSITQVKNQYKRYYQSLSEISKVPRTKTYSTVIFFFLVVSLFGWYAIRPTVQTILYLRREITDNEKVNKTMDDKINVLIQTQAAYEAVVSKLPILAAAIPADPSIIALASQIQNMTHDQTASLSAVQISAVPVGDTSKEPKPVSIPFSFTVTGTYQQVTTVLRQLNELRRIVTVDSIVFSQPKETKGEPTKAILQLTIKALSYFALPLQTYEK